MILKNKQPIRLENRLNSIHDLSVISKLESVNSDLIKMLMGKKLGSGYYRSVYEFNLNPDKYVIKIEPNSTDSNNNEFLIWNEVSWLTGKLSWVKDWFAPVLYMSPDAKILIMERTYDQHKIRGKNIDIPNEVPSFLSDIKLDNFGWLNGKFVCHDYGFINRFIKYENKFRKANW